MKGSHLGYDISLFSTASPLFFKISATVTTVAIAGQKVNKKYMRNRLNGMTIHKSSSRPILLGNLDCEYHSAMS